MDTSSIYFIYTKEYSIVELFEICKKLSNTYSIYLGVDSIVDSKILIEGCKYISGINYFKKNADHKPYIVSKNINSFGYFNSTPEKLIKQISKIKRKKIPIELIVLEDISNINKIIGGSIDKLKDITYEDIPVTNLIYDGLYFAKVVKVYDGDTLTLIWDFNNTLIKHSCRMTFYNANEISDTDNIKQELAHTQKKYLETLIGGKVIKVMFHNKVCPYKRPLITLFNLEENVFSFSNSINSHMINTFKFDIYNPSKISL